MGKRTLTRTWHSRITARIRNGLRQEGRLIPWYVASVASHEVLDMVTQRIDHVTDMNARSMYFQLPAAGKNKVETTLTHDSVRVSVDIDKDGNVLGVEVNF